MKLFELYAELGLDAKKFNKGIDSASKSGKGLANTLTGGFQKVSATTIAMGHLLYDVGKTIVNVSYNFGKAIVNEYAKTEQLIGGIETLFGSSAQTVIDNAQRAYKTAGMSANQYMETVTAFSASLLQSLGGDTAAAARISDMAVQDMSDNANKMGTDMGLILNAYQGFAKQNYTMLDNLKLGYGGTRSEMLRLLKDAEAIQRKNGKNVKYSINSLDDIFEAIHVIQTEMGITGTTAEEAMNTISGSFAMFKAAWTNLLAGFGTEQEMDDLVDGLLESGKYLIRNIMDLVPRIGKRAIQAVDSFLMNFDFYRTLKHAFDQGGWEAVASASIGMLKQAFIDFWNNDLPQLATDGVNLLISGINALFGTNIPKIKTIDLPTWEELSSAVSTWWEGIRSSLEGAATWVLGIFSEPVATADNVKSAVSTWWTGTALPAIQEACTWVLGLFGAPTATEDDAKKVVLSWWEGIGAGVASICTFVASLTGFSDGTSEGIGKTIEDWWNTLTAGLVNVGKLLLSLVTPDANDTNQSAKDILDWFNQQFLPAVGDALKITVKVGVELIAGTLEAIWGTLEDLWYDFLESIGFGRPKEGSNQFTNDLAHQIAVQTKATNEEATVTGGVYAGKYAAYTDDTYLGDLMRTYGASYLANGRNVYDWSAETSELTGAQKDVWSMFVEDMTRSAEGLTEEIFDSWFEAPESEENESGVPLEAIESMLSTLTTVVAEMPDQAASAAAAAAAGHLSGAKVEMDGQAVGQIVLPTVSAGLARANRAALKAAAAH